MNKFPVRVRPASAYVIWQGGLHRDFSSGDRTIKISTETARMMAAPELVAIHGEGHASYNFINRDRQQAAHGNDIQPFIEAFTFS